MREPLDRPNFILILCEDLGYGDIGCYGSEKHSTPRLDQAAAEGIRFTNFYAGSPVCSPSRAALMTGCYPQRVGLGAGVDHPVLMPGDAIGLDPSELTVARALKERDYATSGLVARGGVSVATNQPEANTPRVEVYRVGLNKGTKCL